MKRIYLISKTGPEWSTPVHARTSKAAAERDAASLQQALEKRVAAQTPGQRLTLAEVNDSLSSYTITPIEVLE